MNPVRHGACTLTLKAMLTRLHLQGALHKTIDCHKHYKNEFDFSRYTLLTSIERKYQKEIASVLLIQMLL